MHSRPFLTLLRALTGRTATTATSEIRRFRPGLDYTLAHVGAWARQRIVVGVGVRVWHRLGLGLGLGISELELGLVLVWSGWVGWGNRGGGWGGTRRGRRQGNLLEMNHPTHQLPSALNHSTPHPTAAITAFPATPRHTAFQRVHGGISLLRGHVTASCEALGER